MSEGRFMSIGAWKASVARQKDFVCIFPFFLFPLFSSLSFSSPSLAPCLLISLLFSLLSLFLQTALISRIDD